MKLRTFNYKKTNSTNDTAINKIKKGFVSGIVCSETQKNGRGQYGKKWISIKGNLFLSIFFEINKKITLKKITKFNCLILKKILSKYVKQRIFVKLPNDLLINNKKICGILQESIISNNKKYLIVGIGINLTKSPIIKNYPTTNLLKITGKKIDRYVLFNYIKKNYEKNLKYLCI